MPPTENSAALFGWHSQDSRAQQARWTPPTPLPPTTAPAAEIPR